MHYFIFNFIGFDIDASYLKNQCHCVCQMVIFFSCFHHFFGIYLLEFYFKIFYFFPLIQKLIYISSDSWILLLVHELQVILCNSLFSFPSLTFFLCRQTLGKSLHVSGLGFSVRIEEGLGFLLETFLKPSEVLFPRFVLFPNVGLVLPFSAVQNLSFGSCLLRLSRLKRRPGFPIDSSEVLRRGWPIRFVSPCLLANICVLGSFYLK